jgi:hypothetical protein
MLATTTTLEHIAHWMKTHLSLARFSGPGSFIRMCSSVDCITIPPAFRFSVHTGAEYRGNTIYEVVNMIYNICVPGRRYTAVEVVDARVSIVLTVPDGYCRGGRLLAAAALL